MNDELARRIPTVKIVLQGVPEGRAPSVRIDGNPIPAAALVAPYAVDPGKHVITASVDGGSERKAELEVAERDAKEVTIDVPPPPATPASGPSPPEATTEPATPSPPEA